jgi:hypothetical protein
MVCLWIVSTLYSSSISLCGGPGPISHMDWSQFDGDGPPSLNYGSCRS